MSELTTSALSQLTEWELIGKFSRRNHTLFLLKNKKKEGLGVLLDSSARSTAVQVTLELPTERVYTTATCLGDCCWPGKEDGVLARRIARDARRHGLTRVVTRKSSSWDKVFGEADEEEECQFFGTCHWNVLDMK